MQIEKNRAPEKGFNLLSGVQPDGLEVPDFLLQVEQGEGMGIDPVRRNFGVPTRALAA